MRSLVASASLEVQLGAGVVAHQRREDSQSPAYRSHLGEVEADDAQRLRVRDEAFVDRRRTLRGIDDAAHLDQGEQRRRPDRIEVEHVEIGGVAAEPPSRLVVQPGQGLGQRHRRRPSGQLRELLEQLLRGFDEMRDLAALPAEHERLRAPNDERVGMVGGNADLEGFVGVALRVVEAPLEQREGDWSHITK